MAQRPCLPQGVGQRVAAGQILPAKEQAARPGPAGQGQRLPGGDVVRLLVDVDDIRGGVEPAAQTGVVVQVKVPVEADRIGDQAVAGRIAAFQRGLAALVAPGRRHNHRQVDAEPGDFLQLALVNAHDAGLGEHQDAHTVSSLPPRAARGRAAPGSEYTAGGGPPGWTAGAESKALRQGEPEGASALG